MSPDNSTLRTTHYFCVIPAPPKMHKPNLPMRKQTHIEGTLQITYTLQKCQCPKTQRLKNCSKLKTWKRNTVHNQRFSYAIKGIIGTTDKI